MTFPVLERADVRHLVYEQPEAAVDLILKLLQRVAELEAQVVELKKKVQQLEAEHSRNSQNSSKPPSTDRFISKPSPKRKKGRKRPGGQPGHSGHTLTMSKSPDRIEVLPAEECMRCGDKLPAKVSAHESRQVYDIQIKMAVTEYRAEIKDCSCGCRTRAIFPEGVTHRTQYGHGTRVLLVYMNQYQLIPYARTVEFIRDITGHTISEGTLYNSVATCHRNLEPFQEHVRDLLRREAVVGFDETGARCAGKMHWIHTSCTPQLTLLMVQNARGFAGMKNIGILPSFRGVAVHDCMQSYYRFEKCLHALCGAHILRELEFLAEIYRRKWAGKMRTLMVRMESAVERARAAQKPRLEPRHQGRFEAQYDRIVLAARRAEPLNKKQKGTRGRTGQTKGRNLAERLLNRKDDILRFMRDLAVPFTNNDSERSFRMTKTQQKISGCFRSSAGAEMYCRIRSYIDTARKNQQPVLEALENALRGKPYLPRGQPRCNLI